MHAPPYRTALTSTEVKKQYKKNAQNISARQQKQLERASELDERAAKCRDAEERRKAAKKKREQREDKEERARRQIGVGLATQMIGYSHTQAQLKNGMEAFLGVSKRKQEEQRKKDFEFIKRLEVIAQEVEKEPWDDDDTDDIAPDLTNPNVSFGEQWVDDNLDDDSLLEAHDLVVLDPVDETPSDAPPSPAFVPAPASLAATTPLHVPAKNDPNFMRIHGPINKVVESYLDKLPEELIELLSQDFSMNVPDWNPPLGLLYKLNPVGLPPHRLRIKVGCTVTVLRDLNISSQLPKSQHLRILRAESHRLECLVLDGQLVGTKTFITRIPFEAKYKNQGQYPFRRSQFPIRVATEYTPSVPIRDIVQSGFKLPSIPGRMAPPSLPKKPAAPVTKAKSSEVQNLGFKVPGLPASNSSLPTLPRSILTSPGSHLPPSILDGWDDFLESGTQIARELSTEVRQPLVKKLVAVVAPLPLLMDSLPPMSTQDLDFSMDDLNDDSPLEQLATICVINSQLNEHAKLPATSHEAPVGPQHTETPRLNVVSDRTKGGLPLVPARAKPLHGSGKSVRSHQQSTGVTPIDLSKLRASQKPPSVSDRPGLKRKAFTGPHAQKAPTLKRQCARDEPPVLPVKAVPSVKVHSFTNEFMMSTQDVVSFFEDDDDDDNWSFGGSPPISV